MVSNLFITFELLLRTWLDSKVKDFIYSVDRFIFWGVENDDERSQ